MKNSNSYQSVNAHKGILVIFIMVALALMSCSIFSQEVDLENPSWKVDYVSVGSGETPLSSGISIATSISKGKHNLSCDYNSILGEALYFYSPIEQLSFGYSGGVFKNSFWTGPIASLNLFKGHFTTLNWLGWSLGNPEGKKTAAEVKFCFSYQQFNLNFKPVQIYYALMHYQNCPAEHIFGTRETFNIYEKFSLSIGVGYMLTADKVIWGTGVEYKF